MHPTGQKTDRFFKTTSLRSMAIIGLCALAVGLSPLFASPSQAQSREAFAQAVIKACTERTRSFQARKNRLVALGFQELPGRTDRWVQGQVVHIAMGDLDDSDQFDWSEIRDIYRRFQSRADEGTLFSDDSRWPDFTHPGMDMDLSLVGRDGDHSCSIALGLTWQGVLPGLRTQRIWRTRAGDYVDYHLPGAATAFGSTLTDLWDRAIRGPRTVSGFLILTDK